MALLTLAEILATPLGKTPVIEEMQSLVQHVLDNQQAIATANPSAETYRTGIDERYVMLELDGVANNYRSIMVGIDGMDDEDPPAPLYPDGVTLYEGAKCWLYNDDVALVPNTGVCTFDAGTNDGAMPIKKIHPSGLIDLSAGDIQPSGVAMVFSDRFSCWVILNPTNYGIAHIYETSEPTNAALYNEGDLIYVVGVLMAAS